MTSSFQPLRHGECFLGKRVATRSAMLLVMLLVCRQPRAETMIPLRPAQREKLARLVQTDAEAASQFKKFRRLADASLNDPPHPVRQIRTAGRLGADPAKVESRAALEDMKKLEAFGFTGAVTSNAAYGTAAKTTILSWAQTYQPSGMPVDETKLEPLFLAYGLTGKDFSAEEKKMVETWLRLIAERQLTAVRLHSVTASNNWNSHRLKIIGLIAFLLEDRSLIDRVGSGFKQQIETNLLPDGSSLDFHERDALHYHCYDLEPLLTLAIAAHQHGFEWYDYQSPRGASLRKSVNFLVPYCNGGATHHEWVNSKVKFDRTRAEAGEARFEIGAAFNPRDGLRVLELASFFDARLTPLVSQLAGRASASYPTWQCVLNEAQKM